MIKAQIEKKPLAFGYDATTSQVLLKKVKLPRGTIAKINFSPKFEH